MVGGADQPQVIFLYFFCSKLKPDTALLMERCEQSFATHDLTWQRRNKKQTNLISDLSNQSGPIKGFQKSRKKVKESRRRIFKNLHCIFRSSKISCRILQSYSKVNPFFPFENFLKHWLLAPFNTGLWLNCFKLKTSFIALMQWRWTCVFWTLLELFFTA